MRSMTGYGEGRAESGGLRVSASIRTVNHRFLDLSIRLPEGYRAFELELTTLVKNALARGRVEVRYRVDADADAPVRAKVRHDVVSGYLEAARKIAAAEGLSGAPEIGDLLRLPEAIAVATTETTAGPEQLGPFADATRAALAAVVASREDEGRKLEEIVRRQLDELEAVRSDLARAAPEAKKRLAEGLERRLGELLGERGVDADRLAQEVAVLADRADVQEELDRLGAHLESFRSLSAGTEPHGKRMDFLGQEILRELNTLGSKCRNSSMADRVVDGKVVCEQLREQIQNIE